MAFQNKKFYYKVFDKSGTFLTTWSADVVNTPSFYAVINGGLSELQIKLAREFGDFGEDSDVKFRNEVQLWITDKETGNDSILIYSGFISDYSPVLEEEQEYVMVNCLGYVVDVEDSDFVDTNGNTAIKYASKDPGYIIRDILTKFGGKITGDISTVENTGTAVDYTFNNSNIRSAIDKAKEMSLADWYWYVRADNKLVFKKKVFNAL